VRLHDILVIVFPGSKDLVMETSKGDVWRMLAARLSAQIIVCISSRQRRQLAQQRGSGRGLGNGVVLVWRFGKDRIQGCTKRWRMKLGLETELMVSRVMRGVEDQLVVAECMSKSKYGIDRMEFGCRNCS
jgi:hypothetical protein